MFDGMMKMMVVVEMVMRGWKLRRDEVEERLRGLMLMLLFVLRGLDGGRGSVGGGVGIGR